MDEARPRIAVMTSGGDAPGMNAAIRAVVRCGIAAGFEPWGVRDGFEGLVAGRMVPLDARDVGGILHRGGTVLGSARLPSFAQAPVRREAVDRLREHRIRGLVVIGGNGSQAGALALARMGVRVVGVASTIDNDLTGSDVCIGVDTALNVALEAIDRLKTTASSHHRAFLVEVMGRGCGYLALMAGLAGGATDIVIPEAERTPAQVARAVSRAYADGKTHAVVLVAEGARNDAARLSAWFHRHEARLGFEMRATILGHVQRGGIPSAFDRMLATRLGAAAIEELARGRGGRLVGRVMARTVFTPLDKLATLKKPLDIGLLELVRKLAA